jgi:hypothetical protein
MAGDEDKKKNLENNSETKPKDTSSDVKSGANALLSLWLVQIIFSIGYFMVLGAILYSQAEVPFIIVLFYSGMLGGIVNTYVRLKDIPVDNNIDNTWQAISLFIISILISPIMAGVFGVIIYILFITNLVNGSYFPNISPIGDTIFVNLSMFDYFDKVTPYTYIDSAKAIIWSFMAGFSEKLVPNMLDSLRSSKDSAGNAGNAGNVGNAGDDK